MLFTASDGWGFLFTCSPILDLGHFSQVILPIVLQFMPNHQVLFTASDGWGYFFFDLFSHSGLRAFFTMILPIVLQIMPPQKNNPNHQVLWTASDGWGFFFDLCSHSGLRAFFTSDFANCTTNYAPTIRCCSQHLMVGVIFFLTCSPILDLGHFSQWFCQLYYKLCNSPKITPTIRCCEQHLMVGVNFFFDLFSHSGLRAFFTSDFANCTTNYASPQK